MKVLGVDPGRTTGYALLDVHGPSSFEVLESGAVTGFEAVEFLMGLEDVGTYVLENFTLWPASAHQVSQNDPELMTAGILWTLKFLIQRKGKTPVIQQPADKKGCPDALLKKYGLWRVGQTAHERDALRHVVIYARRQHARNNQKAQRDRLRARLGGAQGR